MRSQLARHVRAYGMGRLKASDHPSLGGTTGTDAVRRAIVRGYFANAARQEAPGHYTSVLRGAQLRLNPNSTLYKVPPPWLVFHETVLTTHESILGATTVQEAWLAELAPHFYTREEPAAKRRRVGPQAEPAAAQQQAAQGPQEGAAPQATAGGLRRMEWMGDASMF